MAVEAREGLAWWGAQPGGSARWLRRAAGAAARAGREGSFQHETWLPQFASMTMEIRERRMCRRQCYKEVWGREKEKMFSVPVK